MKPKENEATGASATAEGPFRDNPWSQAPLPEQLQEPRERLLRSLEAVKEREAASATLYGELNALEDEKREILQKAAEVKSGPGSAMELGGQLAAIDHAVDILNSRIEAKRIEAREAENAVLSRSSSIRSIAPETAQVFVDIVVAERKKQVESLLGTWRAKKEHWASLLEVFRDTEDFAALEAAVRQIGLISEGPDGREKRGSHDLLVKQGEIIAAATETLPADVLATLPAAPAPTA